MYLQVCPRAKSSSGRKNTVLLPMTLFTGWTNFHKTMTTMNSKQLMRLFAAVCLAALYTGCTTPASLKRSENKNTPAHFPRERDTVSAAATPYNKFFTDPNLVQLIDTA